MAIVNAQDQAAPEPAPEADFKFFPASPPLNRFVEYFYYSRVSQSFTDGVDAMRAPEIEGQLVFAIEQGNNFPGGRWLSDGYRACLFLQPAHLQVIPIAGTIRQAVGVALQPAGLTLMLPRGGVDLSALPLVALEDLWGAEGRILLNRLIDVGTPQNRLAVLEQYLSARARHLPPPNRTAAHLTRLISASYGELSTAQLAATLGCSTRTLRNSTLAAAGVPPKHLGRIVRIRRALDLLAQVGISPRDAAASSAFSDQAHMSREFRELVGLPPARLGSQLRSHPLPRFSSERNLMGTGLLVLPKIRTP
ncbi:MAG TPA: AraC family transcriptional regulator [Polyangiaceae bacterium]|nr:AraC family transcriptional regulator [Polyangiaceae bacterium]